MHWILLLLIPIAVLMGLYLILKAIEDENKKK
jgi:hypothetical protein